MSFFVASISYSYIDFKSQFSKITLDLSLILSNSDKKLTTWFNLLILGQSTLVYSNIINC